MSSAIDNLRELVENLDEAHEKASEEVRKEFPGFNPLLIRDTAGRYILLDSLTSLVNARTLLAMAETATPVRKDRA